jgi:hypothetical protein
MVVTRLIGGLGNQMFQYAAGRALATRHNVPLALDISFLDVLTAKRCDTYRPYMLGPFNISARILSSSESGLFYRNLSHRCSRMLCRITRRLGEYEFVLEKGTGVDDHYFRATAHAYLAGYWQSYKYFLDIEDQIRVDFTVNQPLCNEDNEMAALIATTTSVALHVRRGDYVTNERYARRHGVCSELYYRKALYALRERIGEVHVFVFSDDTQWAEAHLDIPGCTTYVKHNSIARGLEDLMLMARCKHFIIANSSFSWWGAWLGRHPSKYVIAPGKWVAEGYREMGDLLAPGWAALASE